MDSTTPPYQGAPGHVSDDDFFDCSEDEAQPECKGERYLLGEIYYQDGERIQSRVSARLFVSNIQNFTFNRTLLPTHVKSLAGKILERGRVLDTISLARDSDDNLRILNGQHRVAALKQLLSENPSQDYVLYLATYTVPRLNSRETIDLFLSLNCNMNLAENPVLGNIHQIVVRLQSKFPKAIIDHQPTRDGRVPRCHRPRVDTRRLKERLEVNLLNHFTGAIDADRFTDLILKKNANYGTRPILDLFGNRRDTSQKRFKKATDLGWYLTMRDMDSLPNDAHKDENGYRYFCDRWIEDVIEEFRR